MKKDRMRIIMNDGRVLQGTPVEIVSEMRSHRFDELRDASLAEFMRQAADGAKRYENVVIRVQGETDAEMAAGFIADMVAGRLAQLGDA